jgi:CRP-like cAMP-binding protein
LVLEPVIEVVGRLHRANSLPTTDASGGPWWSGTRRRFFTQVSQQVACNGLHSVEQRCARWLLLTQDRVGADEFPMTYEFLAQTLGVRRGTVTVTARILQKGRVRSVQPRTGRRRLGPSLCRGPR